MENKINLPFFETVRRSFIYVFLHGQTAFRICAAWSVLLVFEMAAGFPVLCSLNADTCSGGLLQNLSVVLLSLAGISVITAFCRGIILHQEYPGYWNLHFGRRELRYLFCSLLYGLIVFLPAFCLGILTAVAEYNGRAVPAGISLLFLCAIIVLVILSARFYLVFPAAAVDNQQEITFRKSWEITKGNAGKMFFGQVLMMLPVFVVLLLLSVTYRALGSDNYMLKLCFSALMIAVSFVDTLLKASYFSHLYQYFMYFYRRDSKPDEA